MNDKKGFTLVELLAVIAILAILVIIALPNVMSMFNNAKKSSFETEVKQIFKLTKSQWMSDNLTSGNEAIYSKCENGCNNPIKSMDARKGLNYYIKVNGTGKITKFYVTDGTFQYSYNGEELKQEDIKDIQIIAELNNEDIIVVDGNSFVDEKIDKQFCLIIDGTTSYYDFVDGMSWNEYLNSNYNKDFDEHHPHDVKRGVVSTKHGASSYCGTDIKDFDGSSRVLIGSIIKGSSKGCYVYKNAGIC